MSDDRDLGRGESGTREMGMTFTSSLWGKLAQHGAGDEPQAAILAYHRISDEERSPLFVPPWRFRQQMNYLRLHHRVVPLADLVATLRHGERLTAPTVAITFDDGYRDNLTEAAPILRDFDLPATLFLATDPQERGEPFWWDILELAGIADPETLSGLKTRPHDEFRLAIDLARANLAAEALNYTMRRLYLTWDEVRQWTALGHSVGAHTATHPILSRVPAEGVRDELRTSRAAIERQIGSAVDLFAYPNGRAIDFTDETARIVAEEGFSAACTTIEGLNDATSDPFALHRFCVRDEPLPLFALRLSGHLGIMKRWVTRVAG
ncbi:MAG TPA: polysaccharide deacetylase family protein [Thermomicrobiales bacterium]